MQFHRPISLVVPAERKVLGSRRAGPETAYLRHFRVAQFPRGIENLRCVVALLQASMSREIFDRRQSAKSVRGIQAVERPEKVAFAAFISAHQCGRFDGLYVPA